MELFLHIVLQELDNKEEACLKPLGLALLVYTCSLINSYIIERNSFFQ